MGMYWYGNVLKMEDGHIWRKTIDSEVEGQRKKGKLKLTWRKQVVKESIKVGLRICILLIKVDC